MAETFPNEIEVIREALAKTIREALTGVQVYAYGASGMNPPFILVRPLRGEDQSMGGARKYVHELSITIALAKGFDDANWEHRLDAMLAVDGEQSIESALYADKSLGGDVELLDVAAYDSYGEEVPVAGVLFAGARLRVTVWGKGPS